MLTAPRWSRKSLVPFVLCGSLFQAELSGAQSLDVRNIRLALDSRPGVEEMLRRSPTFRSQYQRITDSPNVIVGVRVDVNLRNEGIRARTMIRRYRSGLVVALVDIGRGPHQAAWIAHEFEHIVEQLDGLDLKRLAQSHRNGVSCGEDDMMETERASAVGRAVLKEMGGYGDSDNPVQ